MTDCPCVNNLGYESCGNKGCFEAGYRKGMEDAVRGAECPNCEHDGSITEKVSACPTCSRLTHTLLDSNCCDGCGARKPEAKKPEQSHASTWKATVWTADRLYFRVLGLEADIRQFKTCCALSVLAFFIALIVSCHN